MAFSDEELQAVKLEIQGEMKMLIETTNRHALILEDFTGWRKHVDEVVQRLVTITQNSATKSDVDRAIDRAIEKLDTTPTKAVVWFLGGFALIAVAAIAALAFK